MKRFANGYTLFGAVFLFHLVLIFQGLDVLDFGFHLTNQAEIINGYLPQDNAMYALSDIVGAGWLRIFGKPNVLWARLGGVLLLSVNALIAYGILSRHFDSKRVFWIVGVSTLFISARSSSLIDYYSFPMLLLNVALFIFDRLLDATNQPRLQRVYWVMLGFVSSLAVWAKLPLLLIIGFPVVLSTYDLIVHRKITTPTISAVYVLIGFAISVMTMLLLYAWLGFLDSYAGAVSSQLAAVLTKSHKGTMAHTHSLSVLINSYLRDYKMVVVLMVIASVGLSISAFMLRRISSRLASGILAIFILLGSLIYLSTHSAPYYGLNLTKLVVGCVLLTSAGFLIYSRAEQYGRAEHRSLSLLLLASVFIMLITPIGSNGGIARAKDGMWIALPLTLLLTYDLRDQVKPRHLKEVLSFNTITICLLGCMALFLHTTGPWDVPESRLQLTTPFQCPPLRHIYSHENQVASLDDTLAQIDEHAETNEPILIVSFNPVLYYLTRTRPFLGSSVPFWDSLSNVKQLHTLVAQRQEYPKLFVYSELSGGRWPMNKQDKQKLAYFKNKYLTQLNYDLAWTNGVYWIYIRPSNSPLYHE